MSIMYYLHTMGDIATGQNDQQRSQPRALEMCFGLLPIMMMYSAANLGKDYFCTEMASRTKARLAAIIAEHFLLRASADASERSIALSLASSETNQVPPPAFPAIFFVHFLILCRFAKARCTSTSLGALFSK